MTHKKHLKQVQKFEHQKELEWKDRGIQNPMAQEGGTVPTAPQGFTAPTSAQGVTVPSSEYGAVSGLGVSTMAIESQDTKGRAC